MVPYQILLTLGAEVHTVCPGKQVGNYVMTAVHDFEGAQTYSEKPGHRFSITADFEAINFDEFHGLIVPG
jgi:protease I